MVLQFISKLFVGYPLAVIHFLLRWFFISNAGLIVLLLLPLPSNFLRAIIVRIVEFTWERLLIIQTLAFGLSFLNLVVFVLSLLTLLAMRVRVRRDGPTPLCESRAALYAAQCECYSAGFGLFTFFVSYRLLQIQAQLHKSRAMLLQKQQRLRMSSTPTPTPTPTRRLKASSSPMRAD